MIRKSLSAAGTTAAVLMATPAYAADPLLVEKLAPEISSRCDGSHRIAASQLAQALEASGVAPLNYTSAWAADPPRLIARAAFSNAGGTNAASLNRLQRLIQTWTDPTDPSRDDYLPLEEGGVAATYRSGRPAPPPDSEAVLVAILGGDDSRYAFACTPSTSPPTPTNPDQPTEGPLVQLTLTRTPDDLQADLTDKSFAEFAYSRDEEANESSYGIHATLGFLFPRLVAQDRRRRAGGTGVLVEIRPVAFIQYEREGSEADEDVNNLNFGAQLGGFIQTRGRRTLSHYYTLSARYITDDRFDSSAWSLGATLTPQIPLPGNDVAYDLVPNRLRFRWLATAAADHFSVNDPGRKTDLQNANEFTRVGFDLDGELRFLFGEGRDGALSLRGEYQLREAIGGSVGDVQLLRATAAFEPVPHVAVGFTYTRGENIDSLEFSNRWELTFGLRL